MKKRIGTDEKYFVLACTFLNRYQRDPAGGTCAEDEIADHLGHLQPRGGIRFPAWVSEPVYAQWQDHEFQSERRRRDA